MNINVNMYTATLVQKTPLGDGYIMSPNYTPKKWEAKKPSFNTQLNDSTQSATNNSVAEKGNITEAQKEEWRTKFAGKKEFSMEEWDDFLLDLVDSNVITNGERLESMGLLIPIGNVNNLDLKSGQATEIRNHYSSWDDCYPLSKWTGDPFKWIEDMDFYYYKQELNAKMDNRDPECFQRVRRNFSKISDILKEIYA